MDVLHQDFHEDDAYDRDCTAFKVRVEATNTGTVCSFITGFLSAMFSLMDLLIVCSCCHDDVACRVTFHAEKGQLLFCLCCLGLAMKGVPAESLNHFSEVHPLYNQTLTFAIIKLVLVFFESLRVVVNHHRARLTKHWPSSIAKMWAMQRNDKCSFDTVVSCFRCSKMLRP